MHFFFMTTTNMHDVFRWGTHLYMLLFQPVHPAIYPSICHATYLRNDASSDHNFWYTYVKRFFHFFKILIFRVVKGLKGQKIVQNNKKFCPSCSISQEPYIIWLSFMVHMCKIIIYPGVFSFFKKFWFFELLAG